MIMRLVSFLVLSLALHAGALVFPVSFGGQSQDEIMHVTILPMEQESISAGGTGASKSPAPRSGLQSAMRPPISAQPKVEAKATADSQPQTIAAEAAPKASESNVAFVPASVNSAATHGGAISGFTSDGIHGFGTGNSGTGGNGLGSSGIGSGPGNGQGSSGNGVVLSQARYRDTPRPQYPESARREGREGRVLLRVLVDDQGRAKSVEINNSSGSDALDRAAAEAIRRWRFHPAHRGDTPTESWVNIPVDFHLKDPK